MSQFVNTVAPSLPSTNVIEGLSNTPSELTQYIKDNGLFAPVLHGITVQNV